MIKNAKTLKVRGVEPIFGEWVLFVVMMRKGCGCFVGPKILICGRESRLSWYLVK